MKKVLPWIIILLVPFIILPQSRSQREAELNRIRNQLNQVKKEISTLRQEEKGLLAEINLLEEQVRLSRKLVNELKKEQRNIQRDIDSLGTIVDSLSIEIEGSKDNLRRRLVSIYKRGQFYDLEVLFGAKSASEVYERLYFTRYAARAEEQLFDRLLGTKQEILDKEDSLETYSHEFETLISEQKAAEDSLAAAKRIKEKRLGEVQSSRKSKQQLQNELDARRKELEKLLASMEQTSSASADRKPTGTIIEKGKGTLPWPVTSRKVIASFGTITHPRYKTKTKNDGIDIDCSGGKTVTAVQKGKIAYAGNLTGYGRLVAVDHQDGYFSVYGNLSSISVSKGQKVSQGTTIGSASDYLHFSITKGSSFLNPINYLK